MNMFEFLNIKKKSPQEIAYDLLLAEEMARKITTKLQQPITIPTVDLTNANANESVQKIIVKQQKKHTEIIDKKNFPVVGVFPVEKFGSGKIKQIVVKSPSSDFSIYLEVDGIILYEGTYSKYSSESIDIDELEAYIFDSTYLFRISDIAFSESFKFLLTVSTPITFSRIYLKYEIT